MPCRLAPRGWSFAAVRTRTVALRKDWGATTMSHGVPTPYEGILQRTGGKEESVPTLLYRRLVLGPLPAAAGVVCLGSGLYVTGCVYDLARTAVRNTGSLSLGVAVAVVLVVMAIMTAVAATAVYLATLRWRRNRTVVMAAMARQAIRDGAAIDVAEPENSAATLVVEALPFAQLRSTKVPFALVLCSSVFLVAFGVANILDVGWRMGVVAKVAVAIGLTTVLATARPLMTTRFGEVLAAASCVLLTTLTWGLLFLADRDHLGWADYAVLFVAVAVLVRHLVDAVKRRPPRRALVVSDGQIRLHEGNDVVDILTDEPVRSERHVACIVLYLRSRRGSDVVEAPFVVWTDDEVAAVRGSGVAVAEPSDVSLLAPGPSSRRAFIPALLTCSVAFGLLPGWMLMHNSLGPARRAYGNGNSDRLYAEATTVARLCPLSAAAPAWKSLAAIDTGRYDEALALRQQAEEAGNVHDRDEWVPPDFDDETMWSWCKLVTTFTSEPVERTRLMLAAYDKLGPRLPRPHRFMQQLVEQLRPASEGPPTAGTTAATTLLGEILGHVAFRYVSPQSERLAVVGSPDERLAEALRLLGPTASAAVRARVLFNFERFDEAIALLADSNDPRDRLVVVSASRYRSNPPSLSSMRKRLAEVAALREEARPAPSTDLPGSEDMDFSISVTPPYADEARLLDALLAAQDDRVAEACDILRSVRHQATATLYRLVCLQRPERLLELSLAKPRKIGACTRSVIPEDYAPLTLDPRSRPLQLLSGLDWIGSADMTWLEAAVEQARLTVAPGERLAKPIAASSPLDRLATASWYPYAARAAETARWWTRSATKRAAR